ncbi:MAG: phage holin family protein [Caldilineaceae bacterium]|nr:phage holin family protein [Caldilineaceae bacterium]
MSNLIIRLVINAVALWVAGYLVPGIHLTGDGVGIVIAAIIFGVINAFIKPIVDFFTCPFYIITLGLFTFIVNALMLMLTSSISGGRLVVEDFWAALLGGIVIGIVSMLLSIFLGEE